jgi:exopolysaccharide biosynthesis polyprenyl glycosylphosphotransferase
VAQTLSKRILAHPETGLRLVGVLDESLPEQTKALGIPYLGRAADLDHIVREHEVQDVIVCDGELSSTELIEVLRACGRLTTEVYVVPQLLQMHRLVSTTDQVWGVPLERVRRQKVSGLAWRLKRLMDIALSSAALTVLLPISLFVSLAVRYELGPGIIFRQERIGLDGRPFSLLKFRSMPHVNVGNERPWSVQDEIGIGPVGRFIRRFSLDEIPQLFNVLAGDMSLVGPRPERPQFVEQFSTEVSGYGHRHRVPVGVTGLAAVQGLRGNTSLLDRAYFDNSYIENWSLWLDLKILVRTVVAVVRGTGQ